MHQLPPAVKHNINIIIMYITTKKAFFDLFIFLILSYVVLRFLFIREWCYVILLKIKVLYC